VSNGKMVYSSAKDVEGKVGDLLSVIIPAFSSKY
jgi:hypothetical protein